MDPFTAFRANISACVQNVNEKEKQIPALAQPSTCADVYLYIAMLCILFIFVHTDTDAALRKNAAISLHFFITIFERTPDNGIQGDLRTLNGTHRGRTPCRSRDTISSQ